MKKQSFGLSLVIALLVLAPHAYADNNSQFNALIQSNQAHRLHMETQMGLKDIIPHATSYYGSMEYHYELDQIILDEIGESIR